MATLLEAIALWQGLPIRAALCADAGPDGSGTSLYRETFTDVGGPLYTLDWISTELRAKIRRLFAPRAHSVDAEALANGDRVAAEGSHMRVAVLARDAAADGCA